MGQYDQLPKLASELAELHPAIIAAPGGAPSARAAKLATNSIPICFVTSDSVREGLVTAINRPDGNLTGALRPITAELLPDRCSMPEPMDGKGVIGLVSHPLR